MVFISKILYVIVTYKEKYYECNSYISLKKSFLKSSLNDEELNIYIADNTDLEGWYCDKNPNENTQIKINYCKYSNPGLSYAYNRGAEFARENGFSWVVLLDQDTILPVDFYEKYYQGTQSNQDIKIKVPITMINRSKILSPSRYIGYRSYLYKYFEKGRKKLKGHSCINTGMLIDTDFFKKVGGYNEEIKLDFTDHDFIYKCQRFIEEFEVMDVELQQDFSSVTNTKEQAIKRYYLYLRDLDAFSKGKRDKFSLFINADLLRLVKLTIQYKTLDFFKIRCKV